MKNGLYRKCGKRALDLAVSTAGLLLLAPLFLLIAILVKIASAGPVLYRHERVGRGGERFGVLKFRTMCRGADQLGPALTTATDSRITPLGRHLRRSKLDELPQLWNVLVGEMSLVGPRPEAPGYVEFYSPAQRNVLSVRPGITDSASLAYRREEELLAARARPKDLVLHPAGLNQNDLNQNDLNQNDPGQVNTGQCDPSRPDLRRVHLAQADLAQVPLAQANQSPADLSDIDFDRYYREIVLPDKLNMNLRYLDRISLSHDLGLLFRTTIAIFTPHLYAIHEDHSPR